MHPLGYTNTTPFTERKPSTTICTTDTLLALLDDNVHTNLERLSARQISGVSYSLFTMRVHSPELQNKLMHSALARPHEFDALDLERLRFVSRTCAHPVMGPGHFHDRPSDDEP